MNYEVGGVNILDLDKRKDYTEDDEISRKDAALDLWHTLSKRIRTAVWLLFHFITDVFVNICRIIGISDRNGSQWMGRGTHILMWVAILARLLQ